MTGRLRLATAIVATLVLLFAAPAALVRADAERAGQWHLAFLDMTRVGQVSQGEGVTVAVIDFGVDGNHPDLAGNVLQGIRMPSGQPGNGWEDTIGHGTAMAGLIAAHGHNGGRDGVVGVAPKVKIFPIKADPDKERGGAAVIAAAIDAAVEHGARVISMSFSHTESSLLREAVTRAQQADVVLVAATGNKPVDVAVNWPARYDGVVAVGAVDRNGNHPDFSVTGRPVLVAAPGVDIKSTNIGNGYGTSSGTSDSTAITAGVVALIRSKYPTLSATEVIHRLTATATDKGPKGRDDEYGYGIVNPYTALTADIPPLTPSKSPNSASPTAAQAQPPIKKTGAGPIIAVIIGAAVVVSILITVIVGRVRRRVAA